MNADLTAAEALSPATMTQPSPYLDCWEARLARRAFAFRQKQLAYRIERMEARAHRLIRECKGIVEARERAIRDINLALLRISQEQLVKARAAGDVPAAATALQEITDLEHLLTERNRP